jgi:glycosyltransferase involved in cell wall biosynthesis
VATGHGGILDIVVEGKTGYLFPPGDDAALAAAILSCRRRPLAGLREFVAARFTLSRMAEATLSVYSDLCRPRRGPG